MKDKILDAAISLIEFSAGVAVLVALILGFGF